MKQTTLVLTAVLVILLSSHDSAARKLVELIPGLYGGDGLLLATAPTASHTAHFSIASAASINRLNEQIATEVGVFPFGSSVSGFTFAFEPVLGTFVRTTDSLGPLFAERAPTLGRGKLDVNISFTTFKYDHFNGRSLGKLQVAARHDPNIIGLPDLQEQFEQDTVLIEVDLDIHVQLLTLGATYGVTDRLDIGILVPIVRVDMDVRSTARVVESPENTLFEGVHTFAGGPESPDDSASGDAIGIGDVVLRAKYHLLQKAVVDVAGALLIKLATGDEDNFLGTGDITVRPFLVVSRTFKRIFQSAFHFTPHLNLGYEFNLDHYNQSALEYVLGFDMGTPRVTLAAEFLPVTSSTAMVLGTIF